MNSVSKLTCENDITPDWLSAVLSQRYPGTRVEQVQIASTLHGSATKLGINVSYAESTDLPPSFYLKGAFEKHGHDIAQSYVNEVQFYNEWQPKLPAIEIPVCYYAQADIALGSGVMLLEDLAARGCVFGRGNQPYTVTQVQATLGLLAKVHARFWGDTNIPSRSISDSATLHEQAFVKSLLEDYLPRGLNHEQIGERVTGKLRSPEFFREKLAQLWTTMSPITCAVHGDAHIGNTYLTADSEPGLLDFQSFGAGNWAREFSYFVIGSLSVEDGASSFEALLRYYLDELATLGVEPPEFDQALQLARCNLVHSLFAWVACPLDMQPLEIVKPQADRFALACDHFDALDAFPAKT